MTGAIMQPLHDGANEPEQSDRYREPNRQRTGGASDFIGEPPAQRAEDRQGDGNENDMNAKDFANKERRTLEIRFPLHDANQKQIQNCDRELRDSSGAQGKIEDRIVYEEVVHGFGYIFTSASQRLGNSNSKFFSRNRFGTQR